VGANCLRQTSMLLTVAGMLSQLNAILHPQVIVHHQKKQTRCLQRRCRLNRSQPSPAHTCSARASTIEDFDKSATRDSVHSETTPAAIPRRPTIASVQQKRNLPADLRCSSTSAARGTINVRSSHTCGCDEQTSSMRVTFTSARRRVRVAIGVASATDTAATNVHVKIDVEDVAYVSKSKSQTLMRNFSTVT
jgi:hypothetical protein